jgi:hypothetical protein
MQPHVGNCTKTRTNIIGCCWPTVRRQLNFQEGRWTLPVTSILQPIAKCASLPTTKHNLTCSTDDIYNVYKSFKQCLKKRVCRNGTVELKGNQMHLNATIAHIEPSCLNIASWTESAVRAAALLAASNKSFAEGRGNLIYLEICLYSTF